MEIQDYNVFMGDILVKCNNVNKSIIPFLFEFITSLNGYYYYGIHEHRLMEAKRHALLVE